MQERAYLTKKEAAEYLRLSRATLDRLVKKRELLSAKIGKKVIFRRKDLDKFMAARVVKKPRRPA